MLGSLGAEGILAVQLGLIWASFTPLLPLLTAPRRHEHEPAVSPVPRLAVVCVLVALTMTVTAAMRDTFNPAAAAVDTGARHRIGRALARSFAGLTIGTLVVHAVAVVLGAPITTRILETSAFSLLVAALTFLPVWVSSGDPVHAFSSLLRGSRPPLHEIGTMVPAAGCALGAWLGAIPLCLDWEQPWQAWPLPMCVGGLLGFSLGAMLMLAASGAARIRRRFVARDGCCHWSSASAKRS